MGRRLNAVLADTSALFALLVEGDVQHARARRGFRELRERRTTLLASSGGAAAG